MSTSPLSVEATYNGKPLDALNELIQKRAKALNETTQDSVIATAINVFTSLKADTRKAPLVGNANMYELTRLDYLVASWLKTNGSYRRVVRSGGRSGAVDWTITNQCRNLIGPRYVKGETAKVYKAQLFNEAMNRTVYYAIAKDDKQVREYIEKIILARLLKKESGMAQYAIAIAQAKVSTRPMKADKPTGAKQWQIAYNAGQIDITNTPGIDSGSYGISFFDALNYSGFALRGGDAALDTAMMKAANKTAGLIHLAYVNKAFDEDVKTPFPEVQRKR